MSNIIQNRIIWITGASSGIGKSLALQLARNNTVIASARNQEKLQQLRSQNAGIIIKQADITKPEELISVCHSINQSFGKIDMIIANAGHCEYMDVKRFDGNIAKRMMETNYMGFIYTLEASLELLRKSTTPHIVAMSSSSVLAGLPRAEAYSASKAAISQFMESLSADLKPEGFMLSVIHPGFIDTELTQQNDFAMPLLMSSDDAAKRIISDLGKSRFNIEFPKRLTWILRCLKATPYFIRHRITSSLSRNVQHEP